MSTSLNALMTKLTWQQQELLTNLQDAESTTHSLKQHIQDLESKINQSTTTMTIINPEFEINRLNFIIQEQEKKEQLHIHLRDNLTLEQQLREKFQRIKTELKMLEKYLQKKQDIQFMKDQKTQEQALEEWALIQRDNA